MFSFKNKFGNNGGQTLIISVMIMFVMAVLVGVFVAMVARNLSTAERSSSGDAVLQIAKAGINYADKMLISSEDGADWRPVPDNSNPNVDLTSGLEMNPDFHWTRPYSDDEAADGSAGPTGGYTTILTGQGRFLLRISYNPKPDDPLSKYIKIESVGRLGQGLQMAVDNLLEPDPTTAAGQGDSRLKRELTAYKPILVTDYGRCITNKYNKSDDFALGVPDMTTSFGRSTSNFGFRGFPLRVNGNLAWYGNNDLFLRGVAPSDSSIPKPVDTVEVAGNISTDDDGATVNIQLMDPVGALMDRNGNPGAALFTAIPSDDAAFDTLIGFYRDGSDNLDVSDSVRSIKRLEPPAIDQEDVTGTSTRYMVLTYFSGTWMTNPDSGQRYNTGHIGYGRGIYIDNGGSVESIRYDDLRKEWLDPGGLGDWIGAYYVPGTAVELILKPNGIVATRGGRDTRNWFYKPDPLDPKPVDGTTYPDRTKTFDYPSNGVLYATGDVRVKGMLPPNTQLTIACGGNIYIEGSVLKNRLDGAMPVGNDPWRGADESCSLALLAKQNVVINTTQFLQLTNPPDAPTDPQLGDAPYPVHLEADNSQGLWFEWGFGPWESEMGTEPTSDSYRLFVRHAGQYGPAYINMWLKADSADLNWTLLDIQNLISPSHRLGVGDPLYGYIGENVGVGGDSARDIFQLPGSSVVPELGFRNSLLIGIDPSVARSNYLLWQAAIQPMDVRIEALLYAEEGSLFVIPGEWFNPDPDDWRGNPGGRPEGVPVDFPYYGEPLDIRVIIDGAVSENIPAPMSDVQEWMRKWGVIPDTYGSSGVDTSHPGEGFTILYDDHIGWPMQDLRGSKTPAVRTDRFGRTLPFAPKLPVSPTLIYSGDVM